jgi:hypothetical protein
VTGFTTRDGYAAIPFGDGLMIIHNGQQLEAVNSEIEARKFIDIDRAKPKTVTPKPKTPRKSTLKGIDRSHH